MIIVPKNIVTVDGKDRILKNHFVEIENGKIISHHNKMMKNIFPKINKEFFDLMI